MRYSFVVPDYPELFQGPWCGDMAIGGRLLPSTAFLETALAASTFVIRGLDPRIHPTSQESFEEDGLPGQARQ
jgi:hypothetical protein